MVTSNYLINEIDMKVSGDWVRKYTLSYTTGDNGARSLLGSITEAGKDGQGTVTTLPATSFSYQHANPGWTATSTSWNTPISIVDAVGQEQLMQVSVSQMLMAMVFLTSCSR